MKKKWKKENRENYLKKKSKLIDRFIESKSKINYEFIYISKFWKFLKTADIHWINYVMTKRVQREWFKLRSKKRS